MDREFSERSAVRWIGAHSFSTAQIGRVGVEIEWPVCWSDDEDIRVGAAPLADAFGVIGVLPHGSHVSFEPGGQVELSSRPADSLVQCLNAVEADVLAIRARASAHRMLLLGAGMDNRPPGKVIDSSWYAVLEHDYDRFGSAGRAMLYNAASIQVSVDAGDGSAGWRGLRRRWWLANRLGPMFTAMFANSPDFKQGKVCSSRQVTRFLTNPSRTRPMAITKDARSDWTAYALDAQVVALVSGEPKVWVPPPVSLSLRDWLRGFGPGKLTRAEVRQHLKAMIPPVRACGRLELRMIDTQMGDDWVVPLTVAAALLDDEKASDAAVPIAAGLGPPDMACYLRAAEHGLADPELAKSAQTCMKIVIDALDRLKVPGWAQQRIRRFADDYTLRGHCPASRQSSALAGEVTWPIRCRQPEERQHEPHATARHLQPEH